jgi:hypothetical protein
MLEEPILTCSEDPFLHQHKVLQQLDLVDNQDQEALLTLKKEPSPYQTMASSEGGVQPCSLLGPPTSSDDDLSSSSDSHSDADYLLDKEADTPPYTPEMKRLQYDEYLKQIEASRDNLYDLI